MSNITLCYIMLLLPLCCSSFKRHRYYGQFRVEKKYLVTKANRVKSSQAVLFSGNEALVSVSVDSPESNKTKNTNCYINYLYYINI